MLKFPDNSEPPSYEKDITAALLLSGSTVRIGVTDDKNSIDPSIFLMTEDDIEPVYMSLPEGKLLVAALQAAIAQAGEA